MYSGRKVANSEYTDSGSITIGGSGYISAMKFKFNEAGQAFFKGRIEEEAEVETTGGTFKRFGGVAGSFIDDVADTIEDIAGSGGSGSCIKKGTKVYLYRVRRCN